MLYVSTAVIIKVGTIVRTLDMIDEDYLGVQLASTIVSWVIGGHFG